MIKQAERGLLNCLI